MKKHFIYIIPLAIAFTAMVQSVVAQESLDAHAHGLSELTMVMENEVLKMEIISPAMNLVGFEHKARASEDIEAVANAKSQLGEHNELFAFSDGGCEHIETSIDVSGLIETDHQEHANHQSSDKHADEDKHEHEHAHEHEHHEDHAQDDSHSEIIANYQYRCEANLYPSAITFALFETFPGIHKIQARWVGQTQQGAATLTPNQRELRFR